jgi:hypothetical protein
VSRYEVLRNPARELPCAKLLSRAEYRAAEGNEATELWGGDPAFGKVAASGRSSSLYRAESAEPYRVTEHDSHDVQHVIWNLPMQTHLNERELMDLSYTHKRIAVDEVESKMNDDEHQLAQRHRGDYSYDWRNALMDAGSVSA